MTEALDFLGSWLERPGMAIAFGLLVGLVAYWALCRLADAIRSGEGYRAMVRDLEGLERGAVSATPRVGVPPAAVCAECLARARAPECHCDLCTFHRRLVRGSTYIQGRSVSVN
jgi:hypothetical protein